MTKVLNFWTRYTNAKNTNHFTQIRTGHDQVKILKFT